MTAASPNFYTTGGTLRHDAPSYVERQADRDLHSGLLEGEFCYVLTSRQMGKSSLMVRTATRLQEGGVNVILLDLTAVGHNLTPEQWYDGLLMRLGKQPEFVNKLEDAWARNKRLGPCQRFFTILRDVVLPSRTGPFVIFVDEIDTVRSLPFSTDEFFSAIRECYNRRGEDPEFRRLTFCLLGVATPSDLIRDTRTTPFNIGRRVELHDFTEAEATPLAHGLQHLASLRSARTPLLHGTETSSDLRRAKRILSRILHWTGGHPYLTQRFCRAAAEQAKALDPAGVDALCDELFLSSRARERDDNLLFVRERLLRGEADVASLLELYLKVHRGKRVEDDDTSPLISVLHLSGIAKSANGQLAERNRIYSEVFDRHWVEVHMPDADLRRQRAAFRRGVIRTTAIAAVVVMALAVMILIAVRQTAKTSTTLAQTRFSEARIRRLSGTAGQCYESLWALAAAKNHFTNLAILRDEAIACLALMDLREVYNRNEGHKSPETFQGNLDPEISAIGQPDGTITIRRLSDQSVVASLPGAGHAVEQIRFGPDQQPLVVEYRDGSNSSLKVWNWQSGTALFSVSHGIHARALDISRDGRRLAIGTDDGRLVIYSLPEGNVLVTINPRLGNGSARIPQEVRFDPAGELIAECADDDQYVQIWKVERPLKIARLFHPDVVHGMAWHPQGGLLATACEDSNIYLWRTNNLDAARKLAAHVGGVIGVAFNHRGTLLASLGLDETLRLWTPASGIQVATRLESEVLENIRFAKSDDRLIAGTAAETAVRIWEVIEPEVISLPVASSLAAIDFSPNGQMFATVTADLLTIWDPVSGRDLGTLGFSHAPARSAAFAMDSQRLLASTDDGLFSTTLNFDTSSGHPRLSGGATLLWEGATNELRTMTLSQDRRLAAVVHQNQVLLVPLESSHSADLRIIEVGAHYRHLALHPSGNWLAGTTGSSTNLDLWNLAAGKARLCVTVPGSEHFEFSPDGRWLVTCHAGKYEFYAVGEAKPLFPIPRKYTSSQHAPLAFSTQGGLIALAISRDAIQLLKLNENETTPPKIIGNLESPEGSPLEMLKFGPDGRHLAAVTRNHTIQLWNLARIGDHLVKMKLNVDWPEHLSGAKAKSHSKPH